ncbi:unnamed protein product, partial [Mesorhabditis belari]|uniref:Ig-like domain-containing protein n=1 Tax=Mesorhabditis belari TaxID=2138241 RepID=A0AAF3J3E3_9BILA
MRWPSLLGVILLLRESICDPKIATKSQRFEVREGSTVELPCHVDDLDTDDTITWETSEGTISLDEEKLTNDDSLDVRKDGSDMILIIRNVEPQHSRQFTCKLPANDASVTHEVVVVSSPSVSISPDLSEMTTRKGDKVTLRCQATGNPAPEIQWSKKGGQIERDVTRKGSHSLIFTADLNHQGVYICSARNKIGEARRQIDLKVSANGNQLQGEGVKPWIRTDFGYLPVHRGNSVNISCRFDGNPPPNLDWYFNGYRVKMNDAKFKDAKEYDQREKNYTLSTLEVHNLDPDMFGDYSCQASNNFGSAIEVIHVSGNPGPPELSVDGTSLKWSVQSKAPILEYRVLFRFLKQDTWTGKKSVSADLRDQTGADRYSNSIDLASFLQRGTTYEVQLEARNAEGWGSLARKFVTVDVPGSDEASPGSASTHLVALLVLVTVWLNL